MFGGGIADKFGNAYEARWAARQLLDVLNAKARSIRLEGISAAFRGFEFAVDHESHVAWHQTKINAPGQNWTIRALEQEGVLSAFAARLRANDRDRCVFVSQSPPADLLGLVNKASYASDFADFEGALPKGSREKFTSFHTTIGVTPEVAFNWLRRCDFRVMPESEITSAIETFGSLLFDCAPTEVYPALRGYLEARLNRVLTTEIIRADMAAVAKLRIKEWSLDPTLRQTLADETKAYLDSYAPFGAHGHVVARTYADEVMSLLGKQAGPSVILLSGVAGSGKSGVVRDILKKLTDAGILHLALRIDQNLDCRSPRDFGRTLLGREDSPVTVLKGLSPDDRTVLIVDQIDAVSEVSGRNGAAKSAVLGMVDEARRYASVRIVLVCRSFDIESDERIKQLRQSNDVAQVDVPLLDWSIDVAPLVASLGVSPDTLDASQKELLRLPLNLAVFAEIAIDGDTQFGNRNDLFAKLLQRKERLIAQNRDQVSWALMTPLTTLADWMSAQQRLDAPHTILDGFSRAVEILTSEHLVVRSRSTLNFFHESFFDYVFARAFSARQQSLLDLLASTEQHLFRRTQVRQILEHMRQSDYARYVRELAQIIASGDVRFHIKIAVAQWLAALASPTEQERDLILALDVSSQPFPLLVRMAIQGTAGWFDVLNQNGWLAAQLSSTVETRKQAILWWLANVSGARPQPIAQLLDAWWNGDPTRGAELLNWYSYVRRHGPDRALIDLCTRVVHSRPPGLFQQKGNFRRELLIATWTAGESSDGAAAILKAYFDAWFDEHPDGNPFDRDEIQDIDLHSLDELGKKSPLALLDGSINALAKAFQRITAKVGAGEYDPSFRHRAYSGHNFGSDQYLQLVRAALQKLAGENPEQARLILHRVDSQSHEAAAHLYLETIAASPQALANELPPLLAFPMIFEAGWMGADWRSFADAAKAALPYLDDPERTAVERTVLAYQPELDFAIQAAQEHKAGDRETIWTQPKNIVGQLRWSGHKQFCILETIGRELLSPKAAARLDELRRKFRGEKVVEPSHVEAYMIGSPIAKDDAVHMTDVQWLSAMRGHHSDEERHYGNGSAKGGARQLAHVLQQLAKESPERFARLQLRIPADANPAYVQQLLWGLAEAESIALEPLQAAVLDAHARQGKPYGDGIARLFERHPELGRSQSCWEVLVWYILKGEASDNVDVDTNHADREMVSIEDLLNRGGKLHIRGLNGARGWALEALSAVLRNVPERRRDAWSLFEDRIANEALISVRCCMPRPLTPMFNEDKDRCAALMEELVSSNAQRPGLAARAVANLQFPPSWLPRTAAWILVAASQVAGNAVATRSSPDPVWLSPLMTHPATNLLPYIVHQVPAIGRRLLSTLLTFGHADMRLVATWHIIRASYNDARYVALADSLERSSLDARRLASDIASQSAVEDTYRDRAVRNLLRYFDDSDPKVRNEASGVFRSIPSDRFATFMGLAQAYVMSKAFETDSFAFLHALEGAQCNVAGLVVAAAERIIAHLKAGGEEAKRRDMDIYQLRDLIKTEYAASENDPTLRKRLLDVIDQMLMLELHGADEIVKTHER
ncbi:hypothetical protein R1521_24645 [Rhizobium brockwellii]|uniref:ATP-binding protein n=1 Tax=Rhizobium brockwellii TaxID=3019932 RepID=A0ABU3YSM1_9HYPH|nr:hypothetical protein [Rhizobium brockwellii]MDV4181691.1 hypothetical protein [Rhizobium brockwellii]MDV4188838.1 hypothetical protein [Rhizobium brockwellii]